MSKKIHHGRLLVGGGAALALLTGLALATPAAAAAATPVDAVGAATPVGGGQYFTGWVGPPASTSPDASQAVIDVVCPGPPGLDQTGYAEQGQNLTVTEVTAGTQEGAGYTGVGASAIDASVSTAASANVLLATFGDYGTQQVPTNVLLPCDGSGKVVFQPNGAKAKPVVEAVTFQPVCGTEVCAWQATRHG